MHASRRERLTRGIYYPPSIPGARFPEQHADLAFLIREGQYDTVTGYLVENAEYARANAASLMLLSSEEFSGLIANAGFARFLDEAARLATTQVVYVRRPIADRLRSNIMQHTAGNLGSLAIHYRDIDRMLQSSYKWLKNQDEYFHKLGATFIAYDSIDQAAFPADFLEKATGLRCDFLQNPQLNRTADKVDKAAFLLLSYPIRLLLSIQHKLPIDSPQCFAQARRILGDAQA